MVRHLLGFVIAICVALSFAGMAPNAWAGWSTSLAVSVTPQPDGMNRYVYTLRNGSNNPYSLIMFRVGVSPDAALQSIETSGWGGLYTAGKPSITWFSFSYFHPRNVEASYDWYLEQWWQEWQFWDYRDFRDGEDLGPGQSATFAFSSSLSPTHQGYTVEGIDTSSPYEDWDEGDGTTHSPGYRPAPVPEPGSLAVWGIGLCGVLIYTLRRRRRQAA
jgi:hypothetical protein